MSPEEHAAYAAAAARQGVTVAEWIRAELAGAGYARAMREVMALVEREAETAAIRYRHERSSYNEGRSDALDIIGQDLRRLADAVDDGPRVSEGDA